MNKPGNSLKIHLTRKNSLDFKINVVTVFCVRLIHELLLILKNWLKILLRLIVECDLYPSIYGKYKLKH